MATRIVRYAVALTAMVLAAATLTPSVASAQTRAMPGLGAMIAGEWVGTWRIGGDDVGVCHQFRLSDPDTGGAQKVKGRIIGMTKKQSKRAKFLDNRYFGTTDRFTAEAWQLAVWRLQNERAFRAWYRKARASSAISNRLHARTKAMLRESRRHGPYVVRIKAPSLLPGRSGWMRVVVRTKNNKRAPSALPVVVTASGPVTFSSTSGETNAKGVARFRFTVTDIGDYRLGATATAPSHRVVDMSTPTVGQQIVGGSAYTLRSRAAVSRDDVLASPDLNYTVVCDENCTGKDLPVIVEACNDQDRVVKVTVVVNGVPKEFYIAAKGCMKQTLTLDDGVQISPATVCYADSVGGACTTRTWQIGQTYEVVCPGWAEVQLCVNGRCDGSDARLKFTVPDSPRFYTGWYRIGDGPLQMVVLPQGSTSVPLGQIPSSGQRIAIGFTAYRDSGRSQTLADHSLLDVTFN